MYIYFKRASRWCINTKESVKIVVNVSFPRAYQVINTDGAEDFSLAAVQILQ